MECLFCTRKAERFELVELEDPFLIPRCFRHYKNEELDRYAFQEIDVWLNNLTYEVNFV